MWEMDWRGEMERVVYWSVWGGRRNLFFEGWFLFVELNIYSLFTIACWFCDEFKVGLSF